MGIEFFTGFEGCGVDGDVKSLFDGYENASPKYSSTSGYANGKCAMIDSTTCGTKNVVPGTTKVVGFHVNGLGSTALDNAAYASLVGFLVGSTSYRLYNTPLGLRLAYYNPSANTLASTTYVIPSYLIHVQVKFVSHVSAGSIEVRVNGAVVFSATGLATDGGNITRVYFGPCTTSSVKFDNVWIADDFQGELYSVLCSPTSDSSVAFARSTGATNYTLIDETAQNGDTDYVQSNTLNALDLYGYSDVGATLTVKAASIVTVCRKDDVGTRGLTPVAHQGSTDYLKTEIAVPLGYPALTGASNIIQTLPTAPDGSAWTPTIFNGMTWGFKLTT